MKILKNIHTMRVSVSNASDMLEPNESRDIPDSVADMLLQLRPDWFIEVNKTPTKPIKEKKTWYTDGAYNKLCTPSNKPKGFRKGRTLKK